MVDMCCLIVLVVIVVIIVLAFLPKETVKVVQTPPQVQKIYVKKCPKCGAENDAVNVFCKQCGNRF
jgi:uncharacterized membrane protein YvbJ